MRPIIIYMFNEWRSSQAFRRTLRLKKKNRPIGQMRRLGKHVWIRNPYILKISFAIKGLYKASQFQPQVAGTVGKSHCLLLGYELFFHELLKVEVEGLHPFLFSGFHKFS